MGWLNKTFFSINPDATLSVFEQSLQVLRSNSNLNLSLWSPLYAEFLWVWQFSILEI